MKHDAKGSRPSELGVRRCCLSMHEEKEGHLVNEETQGSEDVSEGAGGLVDLEEQQVRVKHFFHQRVLPVIVLQPFLQ